jgi:hypothetical protein
MQRRNAQPRLLFAIALAAIGWLLFLNWSVRPAAGELSYGFAAYYTAARLVREGVDMDPFYENRWFQDRTIEQGFVDTPDIFFPNPPPMALLLLPLSGLSARDADVIWTLANVAMLVAAMAVVIDTLRRAGLVVDRRSPVLWAFVALVAIYKPVWQAIYYGQAYILLLLWLSLAMRAYVLGQDRRLGLWLGLMFVTKTAGSLLWTLLVFGRRFRAFAWGIGTIVVTAVGASPLLGWSVWWRYVERLPGLVNQPWTGVTAYQTLASFVHHNLRVEPRSNAEPLADLPGIVAPLATGLSLTLFVMAVAAGWLLPRALTTGQLRLARFGLLSGLMIPLQPLGEEYHYTLTLPAVFTLLALALQAEPGARRELMLLLAVVGTLLIAAPLHHTDPRLSPGLRALLAYPKLYGGLLLAGSMAVYIIVAPGCWRERLRQAFARAQRAPGAATRQLSSARRPASAPGLADRSPRF